MLVTVPPKNETPRKCHEFEFKNILNCTGVALATFQIPAAPGGYSNMLKLVDRCDNLLFLGVENSANMWRKRKEADFFFSESVDVEVFQVTRGCKVFFSLNFS